jgi:catechol-2,3-dioxygenase
MAFSHVGLFVTDISHMRDFYSRVMGFTVTDHGALPHAELVFLSRDPREHHQMVLVSGRPTGLPNLIVNQISFRVDDLASLQRFYASLEGEDVSDLDPSNHGNAWSLYFRDPEGNRLEVFVDTDWYISQPFKIPLDLDRPENEIRDETLALCAASPGFCGVHEWRAEVAELMQRPAPQRTS